ncbi:hypothetical protein Tco_1100251 [Tanacetum coccineum]
MQTYDATDNELPIPPQAPICFSPSLLPPFLVITFPMFDFPIFFFFSQKISPPKVLRHLLNKHSNSPSFISRSHHDFRSTIPPQDYPFDKSIFVEIDNSLWIIPQPLMPPKKTSTSATPAMTQAAIRKLVADSVTAALEAQAATMASTDNPNRNTRPRETPVEGNVLTNSL